MAKEFDLIAEVREVSGKGASRRLRRSGKVPAIIYGAGKAPTAITFETNQLLRKMEQEAFFSSVLTVKVGRKSQQVILKDVQAHPAKRMVLHVDLQRIVADEKIRMTVPIHFLNEDVAPGVKAGGSISHMMTEVDITCLPADLPGFLDLDVGEVELDELLRLSDIPLPSGVEIPDLALDNDRDVVSIHIIKEVVEEVEEAEVPEGEAAAPEEGEAPAGEEPKEDEGDS
ncbi:MAG: 50S ribosomal protein L25/general stress protein Ctc [Gammaproteobacteria bacterium]|nr:50S ribosomal protein L25/general stress protein Ctc [Gammaproteobacteria bacterium]